MPGRKKNGDREWEESPKTDASARKEKELLLKKQREARLDAAMLRYAEGHDPIGARTEALTLVLELYDKYTDILGELSIELFYETSERFDPSKGKYSHYYSYCFARRKKEYFAMRGMTDPFEQEDEEGEVKENAEVKKQEAERSEKTEEIFSAASPALLELVSMILNAEERLKGRANNETRRRYFRMFYTDNLAYSIQGEKHPEAYFLHERDMFHAAELPFLDFFLYEKCRTVRQLAGSVTKLYGEMVPGQKMVEVLRGEQKRLPNDVYTTCLRTEYAYDPGDSAVSMQWKAYRDFVADNLSAVGLRR